MLTAPKLWLEATPTAEGCARWRRGEKSMPVLATALHHAALLGLRDDAEAVLADLNAAVQGGAKANPAAVERLARALPLLPWATMPDGIPRPALPPAVPVSQRLVLLDRATVPLLKAVARANGVSPAAMAARIVEAGGFVPDDRMRPTEPLPVIAPTRAWGTLTLAADLVDLDPAKAVAGAVAAAVRFLAGRIS